jgi:hypothetical protein
LPLQSKPGLLMRVRRRTLLISLILVALLAADAFLLLRRARYRDEAARLRAGMSELERARTDAIVAAEAERTSLMLEMVRRQAMGDEALHLAVDVDSGVVALDRGPARLRTMRAEVGPERRAGTDDQWVVTPRGMRTVERLLGPDDRYPLPPWVWTDRGLPLPEERAGAGWTGPAALVTTGGTLVYALPATGPLSDSSYVMPGALRMSEGDLRAIRENLTGGMRVYFY